MRYLALIPLACAAALALSACGGPVTQTLAKGVDEACEQFNRNPAISMPSRMQTVGSINSFTTQGNYTAADCDNDGQPDFDIDANGQPLPVTP